MPLDDYGVRPMAAPRFDLQCHSTCSDGALPPKEVVARAAAAGVELLALSDHDTIEGVPEALEAAGEHGLRLSPATEISAVDGPHTDLHLLGYEIDITSRALIDALETWRDDRRRRTEQIADRLEEMGFELDREPLEARRRAGRPIGRPHIADAVLSHPTNQARLRAEGIEGKNEFFPKYIVPGAPGFVPRTTPTVAEAIDVVHAAGGVAVWAHPFWDIDSPEEVLATIARFAAAGLDGVEVFYPTHTEEQTHLLHDTCVGRGLLTTGSADFHSPDADRFAGFMSFDLYGREPDLGPIGTRSARV
jgi:3',5'-nucleoside bisphosphate phosphatase